MRSVFRLSFLAIAAASLVACGDRDVTPTGITPRASSKDFFVVLPKDDPNRFMRITAGVDFTCASQVSGNIYCWGASDFAQVGRTSRGSCFNQLSVGPCVYRPSLIKKLDGTTLAAQSIDAGGYHACAVERLTNQVWCWGAGGNGQIGMGNGTAPEAAPPTAVPGMSGVTLISAGTYATCAQ
jgi:alpha-tubulin suppressor-like RCC1 family protein